MSAFVEISVEALIGLATLLIAIMGATFWFGHHRSDLIRAKSDIAELQRDVGSLKTEVAIITNVQVRQLTSPEELKSITPAEVKK